MNNAELIAALATVSGQAVQAQEQVVAAMEQAAAACATLQALTVRAQALIEQLATVGDQAGAVDFGGGKFVSLASLEIPPENGEPSDMSRQAHGGRDTVTGSFAPADGPGVGNGSDEVTTGGTSSGILTVESEQAAAAAPGKPGAARTGPRSAGGKLH